MDFYMNSDRSAVRIHVDRRKKKLVCFCLREEVKKKKVSYSDEEIFKHMFKFNTDDFFIFKLDEVDIALGLYEKEMKKIKEIAEKIIKRNNKRDKLFKSDMEKILKKLEV